MKDEIKVRKATPKDIPEMQDIVTKEYIRLRYMSPHGDKVIYPDLDTSNVALVANVRLYDTHASKHIALVATVIKDGVETIVGTVLGSFEQHPDDLPIAKDFPKEVHDVWKRTEGGILACVGRLAVRRSHCMKEAVRLLFSAISQVCVEEGAEAVLCVINPRHVKFYEEWGFKELVRKDSIEGIEAKSVLMVFYQDTRCLPSAFQIMANKIAVQMRNN